VATPRRPAGPPPQHRRGSPPPASDDGAAGRARDYDGAVRIAYEPVTDGRPDPGEVVWTWVPFEEDPALGKDRPVLVLGRAVGLPGAELAVLMLTSTEHTGDPRWMPLGAGAWDADGRGSSVRVDRVLAVSPQAIRREGSALDRARFERVVAAVRPNRLTRPAR
jgi:hypothetical protein